MAKSRFLSLTYTVQPDEAPATSPASAHALHTEYLKDSHVQGLNALWTLDGAGSSQTLCWEILQNFVSSIRKRTLVKAELWEGSR